MTESLSWTANHNNIEYFDTFNYGLYILNGMKPPYKIQSFIFVNTLTFLILIVSCESPVPPSADPGYTSQKGNVSDIEGNIYKTIGIGNQIWMAENLRSTTFNDSTQIPNITDSLQWSNLTNEAYCWYENDTSMRIPYAQPI